MIMAGPFSLNEDRWTNCCRNFFQTGRPITKSLSIVALRVATPRATSRNDYAMKRSSRRFRFARRLGRNGSKRIVEMLSSLRLVEKNDENLLAIVGRDRRWNCYLCRRAKVLDPLQFRERHRQLQNAAVVYSACGSHFICRGWKIFFAASRLSSVSLPRRIVDLNRASSRFFIAATIAAKMPWLISLRLFRPRQQNWSFPQQW